MILKVTDRPIDIEEALLEVRDPSCGAVAMFEGDIRNHHKGNKVLGLEYEVFESLLRNVCHDISQEIKAQWPIHDLAIVQRIGRLEVGETGIVICVSSGHRREALQALEYAIEEFKKRAPVWKKEYIEGGHHWVNWVEQNQ